MLVPAFGLMGAAWAVVCPLLGGALACWLAVRRHLAAAPGGASSRPGASL